MKLISDTVHTARKTYICDACIAFFNVGIELSELHPDDRLVVADAQADGCRILPGQRYRKAVYVDGGEIVTYRARLSMDALCNDLELFEEW